MRTFGIDSFGIGCNDVSADVARELADAIVGIEGILKVLGSIVVGILVGKVALLEFNDALHQRIILKLELQFGMISIEICHNSLFVFVIFLIDSSTDATAEPCGTQNCQNIPSSLSFCTAC